MSVVVKKGTYVHTKSSKKYEVIGVAHHSESMEQMVVYRPLHASDVELYARPLKMFVETIELDGKVVPRFRYIDS